MYVQSYAHYMYIKFTLTTLERSEINFSLNSDSGWLVPWSTKSGRYFSLYPAISEWPKSMRWDSVSMGMWVDCCGVWGGETCRDLGGGERGAVRSSTKSSSMLILKEIYTHNTQHTNYTCSCV